MAAEWRRPFLFFALYFFSGVSWRVSATIFTLQNGCSFTIWPAVTSGNNGEVLGGGGFALAPGSAVELPATAGWSGRFWARTGCDFDGNGNGSCTTGDCGGRLQCAVGGAPPVSLVEFTIGDGGEVKDFYDVSLVDGYNVGLGVRASGGSGDCQYAGCMADVNRNCPAELQVVDGDGAVVACKSACEAFGKEEYCCTGEFASPETCPPTDYSRVFKTACPTAYSYAYDDLTSTCTCTGADYVITFCPAADS
ncbi:pathogenesis-related thaumatin-like protein 3.5 [Andrographis paniculata]|uniref:pathogenesis-related thaumatin-like protein 3.5 n=1 Tax=Andrographis paniculata TaxID=175694 RepID=UPI0021E8C299|nr:pathogenesis-related thaumatin-like protein 3.5 [Andrographis paniculata]